MDLSKFMWWQPMPRVRRGRNLLSGEMGTAHPEINGLQPRSVPIPAAKQVHDHSGVPRRQRRPAMVAAAKAERRKARA